jgi:hypothetical protein
LELTGNSFVQKLESIQRWHRPFAACNKKHYG